MVLAYLDTIKCDMRTRKDIERYLDFIVARASGKIMTAAAWMRQFVLKHPAYRKDSVVSSEVAFDLCKEIAAVSYGSSRAPGLLGEVEIEQIDSKHAYHTQMSGDVLHSNASLTRVLREYQVRSQTAEKRRGLENAIKMKLGELEVLRKELGKLDVVDVTLSPLSLPRSPSM